MSKVTTIRVIEDPYEPPQHEEEVHEADAPENYENIVTERVAVLESEYGTGFINVQEKEDDLSSIRQRDTDTQVSQEDI